jgi:hypothetical protein
MIGLGLSSWEVLGTIIHLRPLSYFSSVVILWTSTVFSFSVVRQSPRFSMVPDRTMAALMQSYKLETADKAQVCDGGSWEAIRDRVTNSPETKGSKKIYIYRPINRSLRLGETEIPIVSSEEKRREEKRRDKQSTSSFIPRASFSDGDSELGFLDLSEKSKDHDGTKKTSRHIIERSVSDPDASLHEPRASRRESTGCGTPGDASRRPSRRASSGDLTRDAAGGSKAVMRKLSKPRHRCSMTNQSVSGIMRPARYSSNNLAGLNSRNSASNLSGLNSVSSNNLSALGLGLRRNSCNSNASFDTNVTSTTTSMSNATWVAHGVEFSKNMEVVSKTV